MSKKEINKGCEFLGDCDECHCGFVRINDEDIPQDINNGAFKKCKYMPNCYYKQLQQSQAENAMLREVLKLMANEILEIRSCAPMEDTEDENFNCVQCEYKREDCINLIIAEYNTQALQAKEKINE